MKIEDNFLKQEDFDKLQEFIMKDIRHQKGSMQASPFPWFYNDTIDYLDDVDKFQFIHAFYDNYEPMSPFISDIDSILEIIQPFSIGKIKANLLTRTSKIVENKFHVDLPMPEEKLSQWTTSIFYVNTNDGYTEFQDGRKVESVANRMLTFPANLRHRGTSCTNENTRVVINYDYFKIKDTLL